MIYTRETRDKTKLGIFGYFSDNVDFYPFYEGYLNDIVESEKPFEYMDYDHTCYFKYFSPVRPSFNDVKTLKSSLVNRPKTITNIDISSVNENGEPRFTYDVERPMKTVKDLEEHYKGFKVKVYSDTFSETGYLDIDNVPASLYNATVKSWFLDANEIRILI